MKPIYQNQLPSGWHERPLKDAIVRRRGYSWEKSQETAVPENGSTPVIRIPNIQDELDLRDTLYLRNVPPEALETSGVTKNWILYVGSNGNPERIGDSVLISQDRPMVFASFLQGITSKDSTEILPEFLAQWMRLHNVHQTFSKTSQQTTGLANFAWSAVKRLPFRYPDDIEEQRMIVTALSHVQDLITAAQQHLSAAQRIKTALMQQLFTTGMPGRHKQFKETKIGKVPEKWDVVQLKNLLTSSQYGLSESFSQRGQHQILRMMNIEDGFVHTRDPVYIDLDETTYQNYRLEVGDILFNRTNSLELVGRVGIVRDRFEAVFASYLVRLKANTEKVDPFFLNYCLNSYRVKCRYRRFATPAVGQANISPRNLKTTLIAIPKRESGEQEDIVQLISECDQVIEATTKKQNALVLLKKSLLQNLLTGKVRVNMEAQA